MRESKREITRHPNRDRQVKTVAYTRPNISEMQKGHQVVSNLKKEADLAKGLFAGTWHRGVLTWHVFGVMGLIWGSSNSPSLPTMPYPRQTVEPKGRPACPSSEKSFSDKRGGSYSGPNTAPIQKAGKLCDPPGSV